jgi:hypothetical protein
MKELSFSETSVTAYQSIGLNIIQKLNLYGKVVGHGSVEAVAMSGFYSIHGTR